MNMRPTAHAARKRMRVSIGIAVWSSNALSIPTVSALVTQSLPEREILLQ
jgi:hypothetical protein